MGADGTAPKQGRLLAAGRGSLPAQRRYGRGFWLGLAAAAVVHVVAIVGVGQSLPRRMGEQEGSPDGISVVLVDEADLLSKATVPAPESSPPSGQPRQTPQEPVQEAQPSPPAPAPEPERAHERAAEPKKSPAVPSAQSPAAKSPGAKSKSAQPEKPDQPLQLAMPALPSGFAGRAAAVSRPPGITRSGENDEFGRGVIRALRKTMPLPRDSTGRVTIRFLLSENGNMAQIQLVASGGDPVLDQSVVFAARQASFPLPPVGATIADRTFLVSYIYR